MQILIACLDMEQEANVRSDLAEIGHDVETVHSVGELEDPDEFGTDVLLASLDTDPSRVLDLVQETVRGTGVERIPVLFVGGSSADLVAAGACFPDASFTRWDALHTALASVKN